MDPRIGLGRVGEATELWHGSWLSASSLRQDEWTQTLVRLERHAKSECQSEGLCRAVQALAVVPKRASPASILGVPTGTGPGSDSTLHGTSRDFTVRVHSPKRGSDAELVRGLVLAVPAMKHYVEGRCGWPAGPVSLETQALRIPLYDVLYCLLGAVYRLRCALQDHDYGAEGDCRLDRVEVLASTVLHRKSRPPLRTLALRLERRRITLYMTLYSVSMPATSTSVLAQ